LLMSLMLRAAPAVAMLALLPAVTALSLPGFGVRSNIRSPLGSRIALTQMAGFGGPKPAASKKKAAKGGPVKKTKGAALQPKRQWDVYRKLVNEQGTVPASVFALVPGEEEKWIEVGRVVADPAAGTAEQAAQMHKRLILEHAVRCHPVLAPKSNSLRCGIKIGDAGDESQPSVLQKVEVPDSLTQQACGFEGKEDPVSGYYCTYGAASEAFTGGSKKLGMGGF